MTAELSSRDGHEPRPATDVVSSWSREHRAPGSVAIGAFGFSRRQWIVAIVLIVVAVIDMTRGYALVMSSVNTMQHSGESSNIRSVVGPSTTTATTTTTVSAKK
jgi:hypothetical protein